MRPVDPFESWLAAAEKRYLSDLSFSELRRSVQALSSVYVERRDKLRSGGAMTGAGKRAAFGAFYGPLHYLTVERICGALAPAREPVTAIVDLGCGTGAAGAAWASTSAGDRTGYPRIVGHDRHPWAVAEARWTYGALALPGRARQGDVVRAPLPERGGAVVIAYTVNELAEPSRDRLLPRLLGAARRGARVLVVEPISRRVSSWWDEWAEAFETDGGRGDEWRFEVELPDLLRRLDRAAGLDHGLLKARTLWI